MLTNIIKKVRYWHILLCLAVVFGLGLRLYNLNKSGLFFYDEAMYLSHSLPVLELIERVRPAGDSAWQAFMAYLKAPLSFTKPIWILVIDSRFFFTHVHDWDYAKYASCLFGVLTLPMAFLFARRFSGSTLTACLSTAILALLPGHVFYSRTGLQEAFSIFVVLIGFYFYLFPRRFGIKTFLAGMFLCMAYLANYRLIILPLILLTTELWLGLVCREGVRWRHFIFACLTFLGLMFFVGSLLNGANGNFVRAWVQHQGDMAVAKRMWGEVLAYPYYIFRMENIILAVFFFSTVFFMLKREWRLAWPLVVCLVQMAVFTMASDRGARYIAVILPFMCLGASMALLRFFQNLQLPWQRLGFLALMCVMFLGLVAKDIQLVSAVSDYRTAVEYLISKDPAVKFISSQDNVQKLYFQDRTRVKSLADNLPALHKLYDQGYLYMVLDPQVYISFSSNEYKWGLPLKDYLGFVDKNIKPMASFAHVNRAMMERIVFEHSDNLFQSISFLDEDGLIQRSSVRIYNLQTLIPVLTNIVENQQKNTIKRN